MNNILLRLDSQTEEVSDCKNPSVKEMNMMTLMENQSHDDF